ncbi:hypothetical protein [Bdellovibrio sp. GT3]|uniref:hypothetical protein n=1 Tax=Bdellovibrio sp. GT3 TaxID=3136282 RepID=UPI0030F23F57
MKVLFLKTAVFSLIAANALAGTSPSLVCGKDIAIYTQNEVFKYHSSYRQGQIVNASMELGEVTVVQGNSSAIMVKTQEAERNWGGLGKAKGFGYYSVPGKLHLDLRNTVDNYRIFLVDERTGQEIECRGQGDCC